MANETKSKEQYFVTLLNTVQDPPTPQHTRPAHYPSMTTGEKQSSNLMFFRKLRRKQILNSSSFCSCGRLLGTLTVLSIFLWLLGGALLLSRGFAIPVSSLDTEDWLRLNPKPERSPQRSRTNERQQPHLLSFNGGESEIEDVTIKASVRGNLGPPSVILNSGTDWIKDRWQAAADMHGTAIRGTHWIEMEFKRPIFRVTKVVIDWEAAFAKDYKIEVRRRHVTTNTNGNSNNDNSGNHDGNSKSDEKYQWKVLYDGGDLLQKKRRHVTEYGQSPGVKTKTPLHVVHTIEIGSPEEGYSSFDVLRIFIRRPAMDWGVSIWHVDVYGVDRMEDLMTG